ncbi:HAD family hydrolase [Nocardioides mangrovicus]|uniref:HAD family hydrolase n=2 Tax=Nocardioides mangrovicus TaxID=2478913 RepID=A0A3L8P5P9_9ACTN|nr:HAD family hydrolase [Nocardioides mangrovicus]
MRSWENRPDTVVVDEPFYAAYLTHTGLPHPARDEVLASQPCEPDDVIAALLAPTSAPVQYSKQMTHHVRLDLDLGWLAALRHVVIIRDPAEVVASYVRSREACEPDDIGLLQQQRLVEVLPADTPVIDAADFLRAPGGYLRWLCGWLDLDFTEEMLRWPAGRRDSDGVWAPHWYAAVERSTGFEPYRRREPDLTEHDRAVAEACRPAYDALRGRRLILG